MPIRLCGLCTLKSFSPPTPNGSDSPVLQLICRTAIFAPSNVTLDRMLALFLEKNSRMIILVDEYGGVDGLVTLTDVMNQLLKGESHEL